MDCLEKSLEIKVTKKSGKLRSKEYRERKKDYIRNLEERVQKLEAEIFEVKLENNKLRDKAKEEQKSEQAIHKPHFKSRLHEYESYVFDNLYPKLKKNSSEIRFSTFQQAFTQVADYSDNRKEYIKSCFQEIYDNIIFAETKVFHFVLDKMGVSTWLQKAKAKKRLIKQELKENATPEEALLGYRFSKPIMDYVEKEKSKLSKYRKGIKKLVKELSSLQKRLFSLYEDFKLTQENSKSYWLYTKEDIKIVFELIERFKDSPYLSSKNLWGV
ncbi:unnamed protein product [Moneuplotes crassus]|uniref:Uncharacterized protein n=1 Tax=Euplotes crassus TaxID=5936 RepID=A0AAD1XKG0_EUPCR|nr:unnamed protein product [Moneuplotes crassus]